MLSWGCGLLGVTGGCLGMQGLLALALRSTTCCVLLLAASCWLLALVGLVVVLVLQQLARGGRLCLCCY